MRIFAVNTHDPIEFSSVGVALWKYIQFAFIEQWQQRKGHHHLHPSFAVPIVVLRHSVYNKSATQGRNISVHIVISLKARMCAGLPFVGYMELDMSASATCRHLWLDPGKEMQLTTDATIFLLRLPNARLSLSGFLCMIILPASETLSDLYTRLIDDLLAENSPAERIPSMRTFYRVLQKQFPFVVHERITTQTLCSICDQLRRTRAEALRESDSEQLNAITRRDNMPSLTTIQPSWVLYRNCSLTRVYQICFTHYGHPRSGKQGQSNIFVPGRNNSNTGTAKNHFRYKKLYLTFDNAPVNKCLTSLLYCGMLVAKRWVQSVEVGFLLPGHGHGLQDQLFSSLHYPLHTQDALTVPAFLELCHYAYQHKPVTLFVMDIVWDWQGYFSPFLSGSKWKHLEDCFGFKISIGVPSDSSHDSVVVQSRRFNSQEPWSEYRADLYPHGLPTGVPYTVPADFSVFKSSEIDAILKVLPPSQAAFTWWKSLRTVPSAVFPAFDSSCSLWNVENFWSTNGFLPANERVTVPPLTPRASAILKNLQQVQSCFGSQQTHKTLGNLPFIVWSLLSIIMWQPSMSFGVAQNQTPSQKL
ncbi:hypothetical protein Pelo_17436 [Pelomyxa schiedti]|nr:hypothetical protein Pelo_17436 [Pelomyxa schiedti]